ncbi:CBS domain-containing protein [Sedimentibacter sp. zth1]|uniref:CBS domain-containing protein n=1 Tax=Sedimentibacter sp. zth1 TaxID=2816908 RepID=UPI0035303BC0
MCKIIDAKPKVGYFISQAKANEDLADKLMNIKLADVKSLPVVVNEGTSVYDSIVTLFLENVGTLFVVEDKYLKGIVSRKDLLKAAMGGGDLSTIPIGVIMTRVPKAVYCTENESIIDAAEKIIEHEVDCIPIIEFDLSSKMIITGRISKTNVTKVMLDLVK